MERRTSGPLALAFAALVVIQLATAPGSRAADPRPKAPALGGGIDDATLRERVDAAAEILLVERTDDTDIRRVMSLKGGGWYRDQEALYKTVKPALLSRPAEEKSWVIFLPWREDHPAVPASRELCAKIEGMAAPAKRWSEAGERLEIGLRAKQKQFKAGGPIEIEFHTRNRGRSRLKEITTLSLTHFPHYPFLKLVVTTPDGKVHVLSKLVESTRHGSFPKEYQLSPGDSMVETLSLDLWQADGQALFSKPGEYKVQFTMPSDRIQRLADAREDYLDH